jgi:hypothetical protein
MSPINGCLQLNNLQTTRWFNGSNAPANIADVQWSRR